MRHPMVCLVRSLVSTSCFLAAILTAAVPPCLASAGDEVVSLNGVWRFTLDHDDKGMAEKWFERGRDRSSWREVEVPHTWQVEPGTQDYYGIAWYARKIMPDAGWNGKIIRLEFDAVYRDATVWVNGTRVGEHVGSGWTPFGFYLEKGWDPKSSNEIVVCVDSRFSENALPYKKSSDWAADGGIIRAVRLRALPPTHISNLRIHAEPSRDFSTATIFGIVDIAVSGRQERGVTLEAKIFDPDGQLVWTEPVSSLDRIQGDVCMLLGGTLPQPDLWHFDRPRLYRLVCRLRRGAEILQEREAWFGVRKIEVGNGRFWLNGEPMRLMGVEWMPGSDPRYGMAESPDYMREILRDMKRLNCLLTRFHWQQDDAVFDFCDREGMLIQEEIPAWGGETMRGKLDQIQEDQLWEMIPSHYNHPSIFAWGLCNEIGGQSKQAHAFISRGRKIAKGLDLHRPLTYASNSLQSNPERDAVGLLDFIEWNEYYESWYGGGVPDVAANLKRIHDAFSTMTVVVSEYGLCECSPKNPVGDPRRIEVLRTHTDCYRKAPWVAGAIFFDYNDYRTHIGDKGQGEFRQRVHGVVDLMGRRKPSWEALRRECSPIRSLTVAEPEATSPTTRARVEIVTRSLDNDFPAYTLRGYQLVWIAYNDLGQPIGTGRRVLPDLPPGTKRTEEIEWPTFKPLARVWVEVFRPTGYSVLDAEWKH